MTTLTSPKHPVDIATNLNAPVLGLMAPSTSIPQDTVETMRQALRAADAKAEIVVYPDAGHAFNADYRPSYHAKSPRKTAGRECWSGLSSMVGRSRCNEKRPGGITTRFGFTPDADSAPL
ncbi:dienelactone hydrolase family protein [Shigella flexneri]